MRYTASCQKCHSRKAKCSGGHPCLNCSDAGVPTDQCVYPARDRQVKLSHQYIEELLRENERLRNENATTSPAPVANVTIVNGPENGGTSREAVQNPLLEDRPWFHPVASLEMPSCRRNHHEPFSKRVQAMLKDLTKWVEVLPEKFRLKDSVTLCAQPNHIIYIHLRLNQCIILSTSLLRFPQSQSDGDKFNNAVELLHQLRQSGNFGAKEFCEHIDAIKPSMETFEEHSSTQYQSMSHSLIATEPNLTAGMALVDPSLQEFLADPNLDFPTSTNLNFDALQAPYCPEIWGDGWGVVGDI
ncbi:hypothetical protein P280DRAFT_509928 [Massarina eburnea CBS 473.64]|uniref:Zn(2)-C6 fungal-type domain-containing protein n=1 Tax=Massarina eburnea CBS 473.64 TaxID=1395130 RepID=A0A6A6RQ30_9PLEO|nr:hypothetical protein P280DRAFT_509928 [Massarina eburnea CBS 473.64]